MSFHQYETYLDRLRVQVALTYANKGTLCLNTVTSRMLNYEPFKSPVTGREVGVRPTHKAVPVTGLNGVDYGAAKDITLFQQDVKSVLAVLCDLTDRDIIGALRRQSERHVSHTNRGLTLNKIEEAYQLLGGDDFFNTTTENGFAVVGWQQWADLLEIPEFYDLPYISDENLIWPGAPAKRWKNSIWMPSSVINTFSGETPTDDRVVPCHWYYGASVGHYADTAPNLTYLKDGNGNIDPTSVELTFIEGTVVLDPPKAVIIECLKHDK